MTDEKRIEEIRARHFDMLADLDLIDEDDWDDMSAEELPLLDPRAVEPDLAFLLAALDAECARAVRAEAELDRARTDNVIFRAAIPGPRLLGELLESIELWDSDGYVDMRDEGIRWHQRVLAASQTGKAGGGT